MGEVSKSSPRAFLIPTFSGEPKTAKALCKSGCPFPVNLQFSRTEGQRTGTNLLALYCSVLVPNLESYLGCDVEVSVCSVGIALTLSESNSSVTRVTVGETWATSLIGENVESGSRQGGQK